MHGPGNLGLIELVVDSRRGLFVGATAAGPFGGEVLGMLALAVDARIPVATLRTMITAYPTLHRGVRMRWPRWTANRTAPGMMSGKGKPCRL